MNILLIAVLLLMGFALLIVLGICKVSGDISLEEEAQERQQLERARQSEHEEMTKLHSFAFGPDNKRSKGANRHDPKEIRSSGYGGQN